MALARPLPPLWQALLPALRLPLPALPSLADIWTGILNAVPKKKTSYRKKRQRFLAGKALKDLTSLNRCSACGRIKRMHLLCPYCVDAIKTNIFGQLNWAIRRPTWKQERKARHEAREHRKADRSAEQDPRRLLKEQIVKHTGWKR